jgi:hypothetical protein
LLVNWMFCGKYPMNVNTKNNNNPIAFHPLLFGIYPVLTLYLFNITEIVFSGIWQAVVTSVLVTMGVILLTWVAFHSWQKAAILSSFTLLMIFLYGHFFDLATGLTLLGQDVAHHRFFIPLWTLIYIVGLVVLSRYKHDWQLTKILNYTSLFLIVPVLLQIAVYEIQAEFFKLNMKADPAAEAADPSPSMTSKDRDVYYILVDAHGRKDLLNDGYNLDTSEFIDGLQEMGFYVPLCSQSNYDFTNSSLASSLNMQYIDVLGVKYRDGGEISSSLVRDNMVRREFEKMGYSTVTFRSLYPALDIQDSTYRFDYFEDSSGFASLASLNFQYLFLRTTIARPVVEWLESRPAVKLSPFWSSWMPVNNTLNGRDYLQYLQNKYSLDSLEVIPDLPGKKFVYAHLYVTHQPFVFYPDGQFHPGLDQNISAYRDQVIYADKRLLEIVKVILEKSQVEPVIVIQGDHSYSYGPDRVKILNAYYFPDNGAKNLYDTITPVNTFRVLFNTYFDGSYELLPDISRYGDDQKQLHETPPTCMDGSIP